MGRAYFLMALSMILVGATVAVAKPLSAELPVFLIGLLRCAIAAFTLLVIGLAGGHLKDLPKRSEIWPITGQALFGILLFTAFLFYGARATSALNAGIITSTLPAAVLILSYFWLKERLTGLKVAAMGAALLGVLAINLQGGHDGGGASASVIGNLLILAAVFAEAAYTIFAKQSTGRLNVYAIAFWVNLAGLLMFALPGGYEALQLDWRAVPTWALGLTAFYALSSSVFALVLWYAGVKHVEASIGGLFTALVPVSAGAIAIAFLDEHLTGMHLVGAALVLAGIALGARGEATQGP